MKRGALFFLVFLSGRAYGDAASEALKRAQTGDSLFRAGNLAMALIEFQLAYKLVPNHEYLFNMAQCEYHLDDVKDALVHYQQYLDAHEKLDPRDRPRAKTEFVELARLRIEAILKRKSVFVISSDPDIADVRLEGPTPVTGQAPNDFGVERGHYRVVVSRANHVSETRELDIGTAETKRLFFKLAPLPARLEIRTQPEGATLYVRGARALNPYVQEVEPGNYEIYAEATDYRPRREVITLKAGEKRVVDFPLPYQQRSGHPELIGFWTAAGAVAGGSLVLARLETLTTPASGTLVAAGGIAGGITGALLATAFVPDYIRDNLATFRIGAMWIGTVEGAMIGLTAAGKMSMTAAWLGGFGGLGAGAVAGVLLDDKAPNYGRVALIQSGAAIGTLVGALVVPAIKPEDARSDYFARYGPIGMLAGLNVGLAAGLMMAYLPDQKAYGPTWRRVALVDLAGAAGAFAGALATTLENCLAPGNTSSDCRFASDPQTARFALAGGALGLAAGWFLTRNVDRDNASPSERRGVALLPLPSGLAVQGRDGSLQLVPGLAAQGRF